MYVCPKCNGDAMPRGYKKDKRQIKCKDCGRYSNVPLDVAQPIPDGYYVKGQSILYDAEGNVKQKWEKIDRDKQTTDLAEILKVINENIEPVPPKEYLKNPTLSDLLNLYVITDYHLGMMAMKEEAGGDWDMKLAENTLVRFFQQGIKQSPKAGIGVLANIGDFLHFDSFDPVTPSSKHVLDASTRYQDLIRTSIRLFRYVIDMMLDKYEKVIVLMCDANHDPASEAWLRESFNALYSNEPRVQVDNSMDTYYCIEHGDVSLFFHHGHKRKVGNIDTVFTAKYRDVFGRTKFSYAHMGHLHSVDVKETNLMLIEQHRTLASPDSYSSRGGWISGRDAKVISYHRDYGEVCRQIISIDLIG
jgi:hypothetical protein